MLHKKNNHEEHVTICRYFLKDECAFDNDTCWYMHKKMDDSSCQKKIKNFICVPCEDTFESKNEFMKHKKCLHPNNVLICKNYKNHLTCQFGEECLFRHEENLTKNNIEKQTNNEIMEQIFKMLEQFTERMIMLENIVKTNKTIHNE